MKNAKSLLFFRPSCLMPYLYIAPITFFAIATSYVPFVRTLAFSIFRVGRDARLIEFVGTQNFRQVFAREDFAISLVATLRLTIMYVPTSIVLATLLAFLVHSLGNRGRLPQFIFTAPMAVPMASASLIFKTILNPNIGIVNSLLGIDFAWFWHRTHAMLGVLVLHLWVGLGFDFLMMLLALRRVPGDVQEAAMLDGAGALARFVHVQLPLAMPTVVFVVCTNIVLAMMTVTPILVITEGGPFRATWTLLYSMYVFGYGSQNYSVAAVYSVAVLVATAIFVLIAFTIDKGVYYER